MSERGICTPSVVSQHRGVEIGEVGCRADTGGGVLDDLVQRAHIDAQVHQRLGELEPGVADAAVWQIATSASMRRCWRVRVRSLAL